MMPSKEITIESLSGTQKAAIMLMQLGADQSSKVLRILTEQEIADVMAEVARLRRVKTEVVNDVLTEFVAMTEASTAITTGGIEVARKMLERTLGPERAQQVLDAVTAGMAELPFEFLQRLDPRQVLSYLQDEHPQTIALVLAHMPPERAAMVIGGLNDALQRDVAHRVAVMDRTSPEVIKQVEEVLARKLVSVVNTGELSSAGGVQSLVEILNRSDRPTERLILEGLERTSPDLADEVRQRMFVFEDIVQLDDRSVQLVLRHVDNKDLAVALKGVKMDVQQKILRNMSERASANLTDEISLLGPIRITQVEEAQSGIVRIIRSLEESGQLLLSRGGDEFVA
jgi:flagellar motor switch protein FliG